MDQLLGEVSQTGRSFKFLGLVVCMCVLFWVEKAWKLIFAQN